MQVKETTPGDENYWPTTVYALGEESRIYLKAKVKELLNEGNKILIANSYRFKNNGLEGKVIRLEEENISEWDSWLVRKPKYLIVVWVGGQVSG